MTALQIPLVASVALFAIGIGGVLTRRDILRILISVSIILGSITLLLVTLAGTGAANATVNYSFVLFVWAVEILEVVVALVIFLYLARTGKTDVAELRELKW